MGKIQTFWMLKVGNTMLWKVKQVKSANKLFVIHTLYYCIITMIIILPNKLKIYGNWKTIIQVFCTVTRLAGYRFSVFQRNMPPSSSVVEESQTPFPWRWRHYVPSKHHEKNSGDLNPREVNILCWYWTTKVPKIFLFVLCLSYKRGPQPLPTQDIQSGI